MKIRLIIRSTDATALESLRLSAQELRAEGHRVEGSITFEPGDAERFARQAVADGCDLVLAAGGDGTLNEVLNGLLAVQTDGSADSLPRLGIVPLGTANDFANWLQIPADVSAAVRHAIAGEDRIVDIARVNDRYFLNVSTGGFGAAATEEAPERVKRAVGILAYLAQGVRKFATLASSSARFSVDDEVIHDGDFLLFGVGNGVRTGGGNWITPHAVMNDCLLDLCIVLPMSRTDFLRLAPDLRAGRHVANENVIYRQVPSLLVEGREELSVNADGEPVAARSLLYTVRPRAIRLTLPRYPLTD